MLEKCLKMRVASSWSDVDPTSPRIMNFQGSGDWVLRRDYPEPGDCAMVSRSERECLVLTRPEAAARRSEHGVFN